MKNVAVFLIASWLAAPAYAQPDEASIAAERARIARDRARAESEFKVEEKACYARFAVNDCLAAANTKRRQAVGNLRRQEIALNDAERKRKAIDRSRSLEDKGGAQPPRQAASATPPASVPERALRVNERGAAAGAAQQQEEVKRRQAENQADSRRRAEDAAQRKREQEQRMDEAREREEKLRKRLAQRKKPPASSLQDPR